MTPADTSIAAWEAGEPRRVEPSTCLIFAVDRRTYAIDLNAVAEVVAARRPHLVPAIPLAIGGVLNVRGEPLPVVDGGAVLQGHACGADRHVLVFESEEQRLGVLVDYVLRIDRDFASVRMDALETPEGEGLCTTAWKRSPAGGALGIVDSIALVNRATGLLAGRSLESREEPCQSGF